MSAESISRINKLPHLRWLYSKNSLDAADIVGLSSLRRLSVLGIHDCKSITPVLKKISGSTALKRMSLQSDHLTAVDLALIAKCRSLTHLNLQNNFELRERLSDKERHQGLAQLATLPKLQALAAGNLFFKDNDELDLDAAKELSAMKNLELLYMNYQLPEKAVEKLRSYLSPNCRLHIKPKIIVDGSIDYDDPNKCWFDPRFTNPDIDHLW